MISFETIVHPNVPILFRITIVAGQEKLEEVVCEASTIQEAFEKASKEFNREAQKRLSGKEQKALPPSKDNSETPLEDENAP
jgi:uncharacterized membrane protein (DUF106 family)